MRVRGCGCVGANVRVRVCGGAQVCASCVRVREGVCARTHLLLMLLLLLLLLQSLARQCSLAHT
jgi:hypothetical protein